MKAHSIRDAYDHYLPKALYPFNSERQEAYYQLLAEADLRARRRPFIDFMLSPLRDAIREATATDLK